MMCAMFSSFNLHSDLKSEQLIICCVCHLVAVLGEPSSSGACRCQQQQQQPKAAGEDGAHQRRDCLQAAAAETAVRPGIGRAQLLRNPGPPLIDEQ